MPLLTMEQVVLILILWHPHFRILQEFRHGENMHMDHRDVRGLHQQELDKKKKKTYP